MSSVPFVSVVVPVYNDHRLRSAVAALAEQSYPTERFEVIVCDNGSDTTAVEHIADLPDRVATRVVDDPVKGSYRARNTALSHARGEIFAFTDADCVPQPQWLEAGVRVLTAGRPTHLAAGRVQVFARGQRPTAAELYELIHAFPQERYVINNSFGATANLFVRRRVFDVIGWFDGALASGGDRDLCLRAVRAGFHLGYAPDAVVRHPARTRLVDLYRKQRRVMRGVFTMGLAQPRVGRALRDLVPPLRSVLRTADHPVLSTVGAVARYATATTVVRYATAVETMRNLSASGDAAGDLLEHQP